MKDDESGEGTVLERRILLTLIGQTAMHVGAITTKNKDDRRKQIALQNLATIGDSLHRQQYSTFTINTLSTLMMDMSIYAGAGNVEQSLIVARLALKYLGELNNQGKVDENDFRAIGNKLKRYISSGDMNALDVLGG